MPTIEELNAQLDRLASADTGPFPVISLYLDLRANARGRDDYDPFVRKELAERIDTYEAKGPERASLEKDAEKIRAYVADLDRSLNGLALFASSGADLFETVSLAAPIDANRLYIADQPHLYPLAKILDQYPRYVALLADTQSARIFVFAVNAIEKSNQIDGTRTRRHKMGGWAQARYQRHVENYHIQHAKEVVDALAAVVRDEHIDRIVMAGDEVIMPLLRDQMPKDLEERIVDIIKMDIRAPEREVLEATIAALRVKDAEGDRETVETLIGAYRGSELAVVGVKPVKRAFEVGQVDTLLIPATPGEVGDETAAQLIALARQTSAKIRFIEDVSLLAPVGGVGAFLRFKL
jgi:peptide subunit release factor 1 (eRF1)